jgi:hypothetical protein
MRARGACYRWKYVDPVMVYRMAVLVILFIFHPVCSSAQEKPDDEEVFVSLFLPVLGSTEIPAIIRNKDVYLSLSDFFDFLKINHNISAGKDTLSGFLLNAKDIYLIDARHHTIWYQHKQIILVPEDLINTAAGYYMKSGCFGKAFGLNSLFNFRSMMVSLETKLDLPVIRELRQEQIRNNINRIHGIVKVDTTIVRNYSGFKMGMADWSAVSSRQQHGVNYTGLNLSLGAAIAGGETDLSLKYASSQPFKIRDQLYLWRFVNNDNPLIRQITAGKISPQTIASVYGPVSGIELTNTPSINRTAFGTYKLSDMTSPGWKVELYVNNELVDYQQADASGFFSFNVPIVYGNTLIELRFYGTQGEERLQRRNITIPFNFLPQKEFEYNFYGGIVEDGSSSRYMRLNFNYGLTRQVTIGGGMEYLSSIPSRKATPFLDASVRLASGLRLHGEYAYGVRTKGVLNYRLSSGLEAELDYILYDKDQRAVLFNYREERKAIINFPINSGSFNLFSRFTLDQVFLSSSNYTNAELLLSGVIAGVNTNLTTFSHLSRMNTPLAYSILSQTYNLPQRILFSPQVQYQYNTKKCTAVKFNAERPLFNYGYIKLSVERNFILHSYSTSIGLRYDFSFARTAITASHSNSSGLTLTQTASGSLLYDGATHHAAFNNNSNVGKASFTVITYLDLNRNARKDTNEPKVPGLSLHIEGGVMKYSEQDTLIRITNLEPFRNYNLTVNAAGFDNLAWQLTKTVISVTAEPNQSKLIEIPVTVGAEVSGTVYMKRNAERQGIARIKVNIYDKQLKLVAQVLTERDGYFSYLGLAPGAYTVCIDAAQLRQLKIVAWPERLPAAISKRPEGDIVDGMEFILSVTQ